MRATGLGLLAILLVACTDREIKTLPHVIESFAVGEDVYVRSLIAGDQDASLWVGTSLGAHEIDLATFEAKNTFTRSAGLANEYVFAMMVDQQDAVWFGTNGGGVSRYNAGAWDTFFPMHGLADYWVYAFAQQTSGKVWIGTWAGANTYDNETQSFKTYHDELVNEWVYGIAVDAKDRVWFGTEGGVSMFDNTQWHEWTHEDGLGAPNSDDLPLSKNTGLGTRARHSLDVSMDGQLTYNPNYVFCLFVDDRDHVWAGTWGGGVSRYDGKRWTNLTTADGLAGNIVFSISQDAQGAYWFGTNQGLSRYDGQGWQTMNKQQGLYNDSVFAIASLANGEVWAGTKGGVVRIGYGSQ